MNKPHKMFQAFTDETRLRILNLLSEREHCVCEFQRILRLPQPKISRHLGILRRAGLIIARREGKWMVYILAPSNSSLHTRLRRCVKECCGEFELLRRDAARSRKAKRMVCR